MIRGSGPKKPNKQLRQAKRKIIPFQRVHANIKIERTNETAESRVFLNDLSPTGVGCFVNVAIDKGELVAMVIEQPKHIYLRGEVIWCSPYTLDTKILTAERYDYRVGIKFIFDSPEEADIVKKYVEELYAAKGLSQG